MCRLEHVRSEILVERNVGSIDGSRGLRSGSSRDERVLDRREGQCTTSDVTTSREDTDADRIKHGTALGRIGLELNLNLLQCALELRIDDARQRPEDREVGQSGNQTTRKDNHPTTDLVGQPAEEQEAAGAEDERPGNQYVRGQQVCLEHAVDEEQRIELAGVPDHGLADDEPEQGQQHDASVGKARHVGDDQQDDRRYGEECRVGIADDQSADCRNENGHERNRQPLRKTAERLG